MALIVVFKGDCQMRERRWRVGLVHTGNVIVRHRFHERLSHAITLRGTSRRRQRLEAELPSEAARALVGVGRAVVRQTFNALLSLRGAESLFNGREHHVTHNVAAMPAGRGGPTDGFAVAAVQCKRDVQWRAIVAPELEAARTPSLIAAVHGNAAVMPASVTTRVGTAQQQLVVPHDLIDAFVVDARSARQFASAT